MISVLQNVQDTLIQTCCPTYTKCTCTCMYMYAKVCIICTCILCIMYVHVHTIWNDVYTLYTRVHNACFSFPPASLPSLSLSFPSTLPPSLLTSQPATTCNETAHPIVNYIISVSELPEVTMNVPHTGSSISAILSSDLLQDDLYTITVSACSAFTCRPAQPVTVGQSLPHYVIVNSPSKPYIVVHLFSIVLYHTAIQWYMQSWHH